MLWVIIAAVFCTFFSVITTMCEGVRLFIGSATDTTTHTTTMFAKSTCTAMGVVGLVVLCKWQSDPTLIVFGDHLDTYAVGYIFLIVADLAIIVGYQYSTCGVPVAFVFGVFALLLRVVVLASTLQLWLLPEVIANGCFVAFLGVSLRQICWGDRVMQQKDKIDKIVVVHAPEIPETHVCFGGATLGSPGQTSLKKNGSSVNPNAAGGGSVVVATTSNNKPQLVTTTQQQPTTAQELVALLRADFGVTSYCNAKTGVTKVIIDPAHRDAVQAMGIDTNHPLLMWVAIQQPHVSVRVDEMKELILNVAS
jgi:hypothetical protein